MIYKRCRPLSLATRKSLRKITCFIVHPRSSNLRHNYDTKTPRLSYNAPCNAFKTQARKSCLAVLNLGDLVDMLQTDGSNCSQDSIAGCRTVRARLTLLPITIVHWTRDVSCATDLAFRREDASSGEEEGRCGRRTQLEVERAIGTDCDARGYRCAGVVVCCARIELLQVCEQRASQMWRVQCVRTLQKSMLFTPLLPSAGPTGGDGDAWPAPTISLTI